MMLYVTFTNFGCACPKTMDFFVSNVFWVRKFISTSHTCVTFTVYLETQGYVMLYVTFTNFGCACSKTIDVFVSNVFWVREFISTSHKCVTFTIDLETQGHMMLHVTFTNFGCACPKTMKFLLFLMVFGSENSFQLVTNAWFSQLTLKLKVIWCCTWPLLTLAVLVRKRWIFFWFLMIFRSGK